MISSYSIVSQQLVGCEINAATVFVYFQPTDAEKDDLSRQFNLDRTDLDAVFDPDEVPRMESAQDRTFIIWKRPDNVSIGDAVQFEVSSLGVAIRQDRIAFIVPRGVLSLSGRGFKRIDSVWECVLQVLLMTVHHYLEHLKAIKMISQQLQTKLVSSMENRYLLQMFALGESLVYYHNALESNLTVLLKLRSAPDKQSLNVNQINLLDDVIIENQQASKQASIYSTVLSGLMDARGTIINNNMNVLLKNLTVINVVFLPLNLIASIGGMSEYSFMTKGIEWPIAYGAFTLAMIVLGWATWWWLGKFIDRNQSRNIREGN
jgi:magnesium transporter